MKINDIWFAYKTTISTVICTLLFVSCSTVTKQINEPKARDAAQWIAQRQGFIENAVAAITHVAVYSSEADTSERANTLLVMHAIAGNLNAIVASGKVDPTELKNALKIKEDYFGPIFGSISELVQAEVTTFKENGYGDLTIEILKAVSKGIADGTAE